MQEINGHNKSYSSTRGLLSHVAFWSSLLSVTPYRGSPETSFFPFQCLKLAGLSSLWILSGWCNAESVFLNFICFSPPDQSHCYFSCPFFHLGTLHAGRCACFIHILVLPFFRNHSSLLFFLFLPSSQCTIQVCLVFIDLYDAQSLLDRSLLHAGNTSFVTKILGPLVWNTTAV